MKPNQVSIRELIAWELDDYTYRPPLHDEQLRLARGAVAQRSPIEPSSPVLAAEAEAMRGLLGPVADRSDLIAEMHGLAWSLSVVDLRALIAFQRRLAFPTDRPSLSVPEAKDWPALLAFSFPATTPIGCEAITDHAAGTLTLKSSNPNLQLRFTGDAATPLQVHTGGPFLEVASYCGRWFLRDGYHRAYALLRAGVWAVPAVVVAAKTIEELGADQPWFFPEELLLSAHPPLVTDFLDDALTCEYKRPALIKTLRITIDETLTATSNEGEPA